MNEHPLMTDDQLVEAIRNGEPEEKNAVRYIFHQDEYLNCAKMAFRKYEKLRLVNWEDVFHESIVQLLKSIKKRNYQNDRTLLDYFRGICRNVCRDFYRKENKDSDRLPLLEMPLEDLRTPDVILWDEELREILRKALESLGKVCRRILQLWSQGYSMREIAEKMGYKNERAAITTKARCQKKLRDLLGDDPRL